MPEFTDDQLRYHAAKAGWPANALAAELLRLRKATRHRAQLDGSIMICCRLCHGTWREGEPEEHLYLDPLRAGQKCPLEDHDAD